MARVHFNGTVRKCVTGGIYLPKEQFFSVGVNPVSVVSPTQLNLEELIMNEMNNEENSDLPADCIIIDHDGNEIGSVVSGSHHVALVHTRKEVLSSAENLSSCFIKYSDGTKIPFLFVSSI
jgi:hypothetical protein